MRSLSESKPELRQEQGSVQTLFEQVQWVSNSVELCLLATVQALHHCPPLQCRNVRPCSRLHSIHERTRGPGGATGNRERTDKRQARWAMMKIKKERFILSITIGGIKSWQRSGGKEKHKRSQSRMASHMTAGWGSSWNHIISTVCVYMADWMPGVIHCKSVDEGQVPNTVLQDVKTGVCLH